MDILIKGMEMPKYCYDCPINNQENGRCQLGVETYGMDVPKHCPLVEVKPHGRLVDADKFDLKFITFRRMKDGKEFETYDAPTVLEASE